MKKPKILIHMEGGIIQAIYTNQENVDDIDIMIVDMDAIDEGESPVRGIYAADGLYENMYEIFTDVSDVREMEVRDELKTIHF